jgi:peptidoglycan/xylan/chitin deacetylase (PgdA/CDA1 family)
MISTQCGKPPVGVVLLYHHIADVLLDPGDLNVTPRRFAEQMHVLRSIARPVGLSDMISGFKDAPAPLENQVSVTFDDGYVDNQLNALPVLERDEIPATVFITSGSGNDGAELWWDEIERLLLWPGRLPRIFTAIIGPEHIVFDLGESAWYTEEACDRFRNWKSWQDPCTPRHALYQALCPMLKPLRNEERRFAMEQIRDWASDGFVTPVVHRRLTPEGIRSLAAGTGIEIGAHTVTHQSLPTLEEHLQREEIELGKHALEKVLGMPVQSFAYPYGDLAPRTVELVREAGFDRACSVRTGFVCRDTDPLQTPRLGVCDLSGDEFAEWLRGQFEKQPMLS